jgi:hypothetical protein
LFFLILGSKEDVQDNVSARLNKTALVGYRIAGLSGLAEAAFDMVKEYIQQYVTFGEGEADESFFYRAVKIAERKFGPVIRKEQRLIIDTNTCKRSHDVTVQNLAQYMALMKIQREDKKQWFTQSCRTIKPTMRFTTTEESTETVELNGISQHFINNHSKVTLPLTRKQQNMLQKADTYKASILLHSSLAFLKSDLYVNSSLKKASSILDTSFLQPLINDGYLVAVPNGVICQKSKVTIYIKMVPPDDDESREIFSGLLASFHDKRLTYDTYMDSCKTISLHTKGEIVEGVLEILRLEHYQRLNINLSSLPQRIEDEHQDEDRGKTIIFNLSVWTLIGVFIITDHSSFISVQENESMNSEDVNAESYDNCSNDQQQEERNLEYNETSNISSVDSLPESMFESFVDNFIDKT